MGFYEDETGHYVRTTLPGSSREATLRREKTGRISLYSITTTSIARAAAALATRAGTGAIGYGGYGYGRLPLRRLPHHQNRVFLERQRPHSEHDHPQPAAGHQDNAGAQQLLLDSRRYQQYTVASYVVGGGLLVYGWLQTLQPGVAGISPLTYLALPVLIVPIVLQGKQANNQRQAISLYNAVR